MFQECGNIEIVDFLFFVVFVLIDCNVVVGNGVMMQNGWMVQLVVIGFVIQGVGVIYYFGWFFVIIIQVCCNDGDFEFVGYFWIDNCIYYNCGGI